MVGQEIQKVALVTGAAGFIGYHVSKRLLEMGWRVIGIDCISDYYDVSLKISRENILLQYSDYRSVHKKIEDTNVLLELFREENPKVVFHFAAQAGVRYSIENPRSYLDSNIVGTFQLLEAARFYPPEHVLIASTSSTYGTNKKMPYRETDKTDNQISFYAATKKSTELMANCYSHLYNIPMTAFRFFTIYGPWGRPDMALFKFTKAIFNDEQIDVYNFGDMRRDFTYIDDLVEAVVLLINRVPKKIEHLKIEDSLSENGPFRIVNIGNSKPQLLIDFIKSLERTLGKSAKMNMLPMQQGDVSSTWADSNLLKALTGFYPSTPIEIGVPRFVEWYREYYKL